MDEIKNGAEEIYLAPETNESEEVLTSKEETSEETKHEDVAIALEPEQKKKLRVNEILELRESNRKVYRMSDDTEQAVFYPKAVHTFDDNTNTFNEMDNAVVEETDGKYFTNAKKDFKAKFSREKNDELFCIESGKHRVKVFAKTNNNAGKGFKAKLCGIEAKNMSKCGALVFSGVQNGTDYEYSVVSDGVKENIIVNEKSDTYRYQFVVRPENVSIRLDEIDKSISFVSNDTGEEVFFIPAPFMTDAIGAVSTAVSYECKNEANGDIILDVVADSEWMNADERTFPVVIDPQICLSGSSAMTTYSWDDGYISKQSLHTISTCRNEDETNVSKRMYMSFNMPTLPRNPRIKKAELKLCQASSSNICCGNPKLGLYHVTGNISTGVCTPAQDSKLIDFAKMQIGHFEDGEVVAYTFDITALVDQVNKGEVSKKNLVLRMVEEAAECDNSVTLYGGTYNGEFAPQIIITYESSYGVNTSYRAHTHSLGRFGQGSIDLQCGNLMFESEDFAWSGNRMPVTIKHLYNSALADCQYRANSAIKLQVAEFSSMKIGNGFKLNLMQSMTAASFQHEGELFNGYVYVGENGEETYFKLSEKQVCSADNSHCYNLYEDVNDSDVLYDPEKRTIKQGDDTYLFDGLGRLIKITDGSNSFMVITYVDHQIKTVTDGVGRNFQFEYTGNYLSRIIAPDDSKIEYDYDGDLLTEIIYSDGKRALIDYNQSTSKPAFVSLFDALENCVYKVAYTFVGERLASVTEYGSDDSIGAISTYSYSAASGRTIVTTTEQADGDEDAKEIKTVYTFDDDGNIVSDYVYYEETGNVGVEGEASGIHPYAGEGGAGVVSNINNLLKDHSFDTLNYWSAMPGNCEEIYIRNNQYENHAKFGKNALTIDTCYENCTENGIYQVTNILPAGQYAFSVYVRASSDFNGSNAGAYIRVTDTSGKVLGVSERLSKKDSEYTRLIVPFELTTAQSVQVQILADGKGLMYADAAQLENNSYANAYNMLENGNFENDGCWNFTSGAAYATGTRFNMTRSLRVSSDLETNQNAYQSVKVKSNRTTRETFTLSGWAKGNGLPNYERDGVTTPTFRLRAVIKYNDSANRQYGTEEFTADFSPCTEEWQFASIEFAKSKCCTVEDIKVYCDYGYNTGTAYFDDIQLVRNSIETGLSSSDFDTETVDETEDTNDDVNVSEETNDTTPEFEEFMDTFGNALTETTFTDGEFGTIYRSFGFNHSGNDLIRETDARGNTTKYVVEEKTSRNEVVTDRCGNKTEYEYDTAGKTTKVISKDANGTELAKVSYDYDAFDNMTEIVRGDGMKYVLKYNAFHNLESIGINGKTDGDLIKYTYKNGNGRLKEMTYANGDTMKATYNGIGQMVAEKWYNSLDELTAHYKYVYDGQGNIVRSIDILADKEYNYQYDEGKIIRATECNITLDDNQFVVAKIVVNTIKYYYDSEGIMTKKVITSKDGAEQIIYYEQTEDDNTVVKFVAGGKTITSHSKSDSFGRKEFDELQLGTGFVARQFHYHAGEITKEHQKNDKLKSSATTQLVSQIVLSGGRTISYEYDEEERITKVTDSEVGTTVYTYDALGQLVTETVKGITTKFKYDNYGNILAKGVVDETGEIAEATKVTYVYGDDTWKDLLTAYNGQAIVYDAQGNPINYLGHNLTWEKGRQLKSFEKVEEDGAKKLFTYTYNANGIRTSKTVNGVRHDFVLDDGKILRETWGGNTLTPLYDNEDDVCGIIYDEEPYYFQKNLQGDIIGIVDKDSTVVARYSYDAWGVPTIAQDSTDCAIATINPFRYRSYYFDREIGMYYLQSRYYDPEVGRFINGDEAYYVNIDNSILVYCLFSYCENDGINFDDKTGDLSIKKFFSGIKKVISSIFNLLYKVIGKFIWGYRPFKIQKKHFYINTWIITAVIDGVITLISRAVSAGIKGFMNVLKIITKLSRKKILNFFRSKIVPFFCKDIGATLKKVMVSLGNKIVDFLMKKELNIINDYIAFNIDKVLPNSGSIMNYLLSSISSFGTFLAFILDLSDNEFDGFYRLKIS